jgi:hypothetical protein
MDPNWKVASINDQHRRVVGSSPCTLEKCVVPIHTVFCKPGSPIGKSKKGGQLTVLYLVEYFLLCLVLIDEDSNVVFHLIAEQDKSHNASTKVPHSEAVVEIDAPWCPKVGVPLYLHHTLEDIE